MSTRVISHLSISLVEKVCKTEKLLSADPIPKKSHFREIFRLPTAAIKSLMRLTFLSLMASVADVLERIPAGIEKRCLVR